MRLGAVLALLAHALLVVALAFGVHWKTSGDPVVFSAELWSAVPQVAAPAPVEAAAPPPAPVRRIEPVAPPPVPQVDAQIAIERERRAQQRQAAEQEAEQQRKLLKAREDKARDDKLRDDKARTKADDERTAKLREANLARIRGMADSANAATGAATSTGTAQRDAAPSATYAGRIKARIKPNILLTGDVPGNPVTEIEVRCAADGSIIGRRIVKPSGNPLWDETVLRAIDRTEVLPRDVDGRVPGTLILIFPRQE